MKKSLLLLAALFASGSASAGYGIGTADMVSVDSDGYVSFGTTTPFAGTCNWFIDQFRFDGKTSAGKNMLATLMAAKVAGIPVTVWYTESTTPGTNQTNGCTQTTMAIPTGIGIR